MPKGTCKIHGCEKGHKAHGWCSAHYQRWLTYGDPLGGGAFRKRNPNDRFWEKVDRHGPIPETRPELGPCFVWTDALNRDGYGTFWNGAHYLGSHKWAWEQVNGSVPKGLELDHLCRVRHCVNPAHLEAVTRAENIRRGIAGKVAGARQRAKTHCPQGHAYDEENTYRSPRGARYCLACARNAKTRARARARLGHATPSVRPKR